ncbi:MAG: hypothetical protein Q8J64_05555 [Thermodesulfovibrionales bacterium]|nr:hypothetical protein [Thermodesulfovibrionales bacterium]
MSRDIRTITGFLIIFIGAAGGIWLGWWLSTGGDIIDILHRAKVGLPGWAWIVLKVGLAAVVGGLFMLVFATAAFIVFSGKDN